VISQETNIPEKKENKSSLISEQKWEKRVISEVKVPEIKVSQKSSENTATTFDFSRFVEHIRTVPKRSFIGLWLRVATYSEEGNNIIIHPDSDFNFKKLETADVRLFLQETLDTLFWVGYQIDIRKWGTGKQIKKPEASLVDHAMDIF
jgi:hypothetical protein